jgi:hypothetical protein
VCAGGEVWGCVCECVGGWVGGGCVGVWAFEGVYVRVRVGVGMRVWTNAPLILKLWNIIFFALEKPLSGNSWDISRGLNLFEPIIALCYAQDHLGVQRSWPPQKIPPKFPFMCFAREKKNPPHLQNQRYINS